MSATNLIAYLKLCSICDRDPNTPLFPLAGLQGIQVGSAPRWPQDTVVKRFGRGERIRTSGLYVPNVALYQAKLHPDSLAA